MGKKIVVLSLSWRDIKNPLGGGAEVHTHEMLSRLDPQKFKVIHFAPMFSGGKKQEKIDNVMYIRKGGTFSVILYAFLFYKKNRLNIDFVIDQCNAHRFFTKFWVEKRKRIFYTHQLYRELWDIMLPKPFNKIGQIFETPMLRLNKNDTTITVSESTKKELLQVGFKEANIHIIPNGVNFKVKAYGGLQEKGTCPIFIYVGRFVPYKGINIAIESFGNVKKLFPEAKLWLVGRENSGYINQELIPIMKRYHLSFGHSEDKDVIFWGFVSEERKFELQEKATALLFPAQREGWGIIVIEAGAMGTPSIVFNSPGCIDAVNFGHAGYLCKENTCDEMTRLMINSIINKEEYSQMRKAAYDYATSFKWDDNGILLENILLSKLKLQEKVK